MTSGQSQLNNFFFLNTRYSSKSYLTLITSINIGNPLTMEPTVFSFVLILTLSVSCTNSLKVIGLFQHPGVSHFHFFHPIMRGLADAGHDVTVVSHFPDKNAPSNYKDLVLGKTEILTNSVDLEVKRR